MVQFWAPAAASCVPAECRHDAPQSLIRGGRSRRIPPHVGRTKDHDIQCIHDRIGPRRRVWAYIGLAAHPYMLRIMGNSLWTAFNSKLLHNSLSTCPTDAGRGGSAAQWVLADSALLAIAATTPACRK